MLTYILALIAGLIAGVLLPSGFLSKIKNIFFNIALIALLFFMGVSLGRDSEILGKLANFGYVSLVMSVCVVVFSVISVLIITRLFRRSGS